jgi:capsular polysaccharide transport system ATP-binding protein
MIATYSGEKRVRLGFTLSYALPFDTYLADEHVVGGPAGFRDRCKQLARERLSQSTLILATRSPAMLRLFCDTAFILDHARITPCDSIEQAVTRYNAIVARIGIKDTEEVSSGLDDLTDGRDAA